MLFKRSTTAPSPTARRYKPQTISTVRAIVRLIMPRQNAARRCAPPKLQQLDSIAAAPAKTDPFRGLMPTVAHVRWGLLCVLLILWGHHRALAQRGYTITDLGVGNQWYSEAHGLNNGGWAVGEYEPAGALYQHGLLYNGQTASEMFMPPNIYAIAWGINDSNVVVEEYLPGNPVSFIV